MKSVHSISLSLVVLAALLVSSCGFLRKKPEACFVSAVNDATVTFNAECSENVESYSWDFGDGEVSFQQNPVHEYTESGSYIVVMVATNERGDTDTYTQTVSVTVVDQRPSGTFTGNDVCTSGSYGPYSITVTPVTGSTTHFTIYGLYEYPYSFTAEMTGAGTFTAPSQAFGGSGLTIQLGSCTVSADGNNLSITYVVSSGTNTDSCTATFSK